MRGLRQRLRALGKQRLAAPAPLPFVIRRGARAEEEERRSRWNACELRIMRLTPEGKVYERVVPEQQERT
jgi:hypothetical protein